MKSYFEQLLKQIKDAEAMHGPEFDAAIKRICISGGKLRAGADCAWVYEDDLPYFEIPKPHPKYWPYSGFIFPVPDIDGRIELEPEQCIVCVTNYPVEKSNPETDWVALLQLLTSPKLHRFHVMKS